MERVLLDTDIGTDIDDAIALALSARSPEIDLVGVTTVGKNAGIRGEIARCILNLAGKQDVPVRSGAVEKIEGDPYDLWLGHEGVGILDSNLDNKFDLSDDVPVTDFMEAQLLGSDIPTTIVSIGPLTNVANLIRIGSSSSEHIKRIVLMGGVITPGRIGAEFDISEDFRIQLEYNLNADIQAADIVINSGIPLCIIPADLTYSAYFEDTEIEKLTKSPGDLPRVLGEAAWLWKEAFADLLKFVKVDPGFARPYLHDPMTIASILGKGLVDFEQKKVCLTGRYGQLSMSDELSESINIQVAVSVNSKELKSLIMERLQ